MKRIIISILILGITKFAVAGGPWTQPKGKGYFKLSEWWVIFDEHFTTGGNTDPNVTTGIFNTNLYAEYGFTDRLTGVLFFPVFSRNYMNNLKSRTTGETIVEGESINSIGDSDLSLKYSLTQPGASLPIALSLTLGLPLGEDAGGTQKNLQTGDGEFNQLIKLDIGSGYTLGNLQSYWAGYVGFNNRTNDFSDEFRFGIETGFQLKQDKLWAIVRSFGVESLRNGKTADEVTSTSIFANNTEFISLELELSYYITNRIGVSAGFAGAFRGEIIAAAPSYSVGIFYDTTK